MMARFVPCAHCGREAAYTVTLQLRTTDAGPFEPPKEERRANLCAGCLEVRHGDLFGGFRGDPWRP